MLKKFKNINWSVEYPRFNKFMCRIIFSLAKISVGIMSMFILTGILLKQKDKNDTVL